MEALPVDNVSLMLAACSNKLKCDRACMECDKVYHGSIRCPGCGKHSGEPLSADEPLTSPGVSVSLSPLAG